jgi:hypothetical protein
MAGVDGKYVLKVFGLHRVHVGQWHEGGGARAIGQGVNAAPALMRGLGQGFAVGVLGHVDGHGQGLHAMRLAG